MQLQLKLCTLGIHIVNVAGTAEPADGLIQLCPCLKHMMHIPYDYNMYSFLQTLMVNKFFKRLPHFNAIQMLTTTFMTAHHRTLMCDSVVPSQQTNTLFIKGAF